MKFYKRKIDIDLLSRVKTYIEEMEVMKEAEYNYGRPLEKLIEEGSMPELYDEVLRRLK